MADLDKHELVAATVAELVSEFSDAVVVTWVDELQADLVFYDMIPGRVSAVAEGLLGELFVGPPDGPGRSWEPWLDDWQDEEGPACPVEMTEWLRSTVEWSVPDDYLEDVFSAAYTKDWSGWLWTRKVKEGS